MKHSKSVCENLLPNRLVCRALAAAGRQSTGVKSILLCSGMLKASLRFPCGCLRMNTWFVPYLHRAAAFSRLHHGLALVSYELVGGWLGWVLVSDFFMLGNPWSTSLWLAAQSHTEPWPQLMTPPE